MNHFLKLFCVIYLALLSVKTYSQTDTSRLEMVQALTKYIKRNYVSADIARRMCDTIDRKLTDGRYDTSLNPDEFAFEITKDLRRVSNDQHISVTQPIHKSFDEAAYNTKLNGMTDRQRKRHVGKNKRKWEKFKRMTKNDMFTYGEIKILPGNIGYVEVKDFESTSYNRKQNKGRIAIETVMGFLKNTSSIIIDLRENQGGFVEHAATFCSFFSPVTNNYFITTESYFRYDSSGIEKELIHASKIFTGESIDNSFNKSKAIYILISHRTFSAAELSAYKIKQYEPSTIIIGEKTQGGGNGHFGTTTEKHFSAIIPSFKSFDESNGSYTIEANGIIPDIMTLGDSAFTVAYKLALKETKPTDTRVKHLKKLDEYAAANEGYFLKFYQDYVGDYRKIQIVKEDDKVFMIYDTYVKMLLHPKAVDYFKVDRIQSVKFLRDNDGRVIEIQVKHTDEFTEHFRRV